MTRLEQLRLGTALAHAVPGGALTLTAHSGQEVIVSAHPSADMDACALRRVIAASGCATGPDYSELIGEITVGGSLQHLGGGVYRRAVGGVEERWMATLLGPLTVAGLLEQRDGSTPSGAMHACIRPDGGLAVTVVAISANQPAEGGRLDEVAAGAMASIMVEELVRSALDGRVARGNWAAGR